ncbi:hypothetical protein DAI22_01g404166 [Oryza sativa Japonica Group]|nr:hypothetical protein DAI22_01g404166 [Oryza sativa Japonica Group]
MPTGVKVSQRGTPNPRPADPTRAARRRPPQGPRGFLRESASASLLLGRQHAMMTPTRRRPTNLHSESGEFV